MVSQGSNCDSDGLPAYMQSVSDDGMNNVIKARREVEEFPILVAHDSNHARSSASGGIPVVESDESEDDNLGDVRDALERETVHRVAKAAFDVNKDERRELIALRHQMQEWKNLLAKKGISLAALEKELLEKNAQFNVGFPDPTKFISGRDEYGLPIFAKKQDSTPKVFDVKADRGGGEHLDSKKEQGAEHTKRGFVGSVSGAKDDQGNVRPDGATIGLGKAANSWSQVLTNAPPTVNDVKFEYLPMPKGEKVVTPPDEVLKEGNEKFKYCVVGTFSKASQSYNRVVEFAKAAWGKKGLLHVSQKTTHVFIFKFGTAAQMNDVLSRGTWYINNKPLIVHAWGTNIHTDSVKNIPLWVKFENIPDCYWTQKGLSFLASTIAPPLAADELTSRLEILPFAKICVNYVIGDELPNKINVTDLDPKTGEKKIVEVSVSYPSKPAICSGCRAIGHIVGACPITKRQWVPKVRTENVQEPVQDTEVNVQDTGNQPPQDASETLNGKKTTSEPQVVMTGTSTGDTSPQVQEPGWQQVPVKRLFVHSPSPVVDESPPPMNTFKNLANVDEIDALRAMEGQLSKSQLKKRRKALGKVPPQTT